MERAESRRLEANQRAQRQAEEHAARARAIEFQYQVANDIQHRVKRKRSLDGGNDSLVKREGPSKPARWHLY